LCERFYKSAIKIFDQKRRWARLILSGASGMISGKTMKAGLAATAASLALSCILAAPAKAQSAQQEAINNVIRNILQNIRDQIHRRRLMPAPGMMRFSAEGSEFDNRNPFAAQNSSDPFGALAYAKAPPMAAATLPDWIYGVNAVGQGDKSHTIFNDTTTVVAVGSVDVTKIGIFTASDSLTFAATGSGAWSHQSGFPTLDVTTSGGSGTLAYANDGFSTDFTTSASWQRSTLVGVGIAAPPDSTSLQYLGNVQYRFDLPYSFFFEPTVGVTYTEVYTANFGLKTGDSTEVHGGGRIGTEMKWMGFIVQPQLSGAVFKIVDQTPVIGPVTDQLGGRGSGKINVIWNDHFSSYLEAHASGIAGTKTIGFIGTQTIGASGGLRWTF
jgi:hypothetical protein